MTSVQNAAHAKQEPDVKSASSTTVVGLNALWQHPYVDVFKHFRVLPVQDWKLNKKQGDISEVFAREIGRKAMFLNGSISANNFIQIPHPNGMARSLQLTGRYVYLQIKAPLSSSPLAVHFDLQMAERSHGIRISSSNLYKQVSTQNGFVLQLPLNLDINRWTVVVYDLYSLLKMSKLLPQNYLIEGSYQIKQVTLCANSMIRGLYTSDNLYDFVTLPPDMRFKFSFEINRWPEYFAWLELPADIDPSASERDRAEDRTQQLRAKAALRSQNQSNHLNEHERQRMDEEIQALNSKWREAIGEESEISEVDKQAKYAAIQAEMMAKFGKQGHAGGDLLTADQKLGYASSSGVEDRKISNQGEGLHTRGLPGTDSALNQYVAGQYTGQELVRSAKLNHDPIIELKHIIGYSPDKCQNLLWSRLPGENVCVLSSGGTLIALDVETGRQNRFFFGHSAPICCFDISPNGNLIASAQEGENSIIRIWNYHTARSLQMIAQPTTRVIKCVSFSHDSRYLASVGKDERNKEVIIVWDISRIHRGEQPEIWARQTSDFHIQQLKFSPIDNARLASCGKENIRFWRIRDWNQHKTANIRGSAVVLNHHARNSVFTSLDFEYGARAAPTASGSSFNPDSPENEALKRLYVASKHGLVYMINYHTEQLLEIFRTNDSAIHSISINEAFCVTGSDDCYLRVWPLDFSEFFIEAPLEGTVCSTDISADGLRVICGTLKGGLGMLDKSNQKYRSLMRAHTDNILSMDFHHARKRIITVSQDKTIRLWDIEGYEQQVEFICDTEKPICVAAHPTLDIFTCGFEDGAMRIFDIEKTCVVSEFTQFNKPLRKLAYSPNGHLLVTCCEDGSVALHNALRQHLPTKMMHLEFPPQFIHVAFSPAVRRQKKIQVLKQSNVQSENSSLFQGEGGAYYFDKDKEGELKNQTDPSARSIDMESAMSPSQISKDNQEAPYEVITVMESLFGVMGDYGNNVMIYDTDSIVLKHQIQAGNFVRSFNFSQDSRELVIVTKDQKIRFYRLSSFTGELTRELQTVHREACLSLDLSLNGQFMLTGGKDNLMKIWDYDAQKTVPYYYQSFIGHTYPVSAVMFNPHNNNELFSAGENDGIYIWDFHGDTSTKSLHSEDDQPIQELVDRDRLQEPTVLERMREAVKDRKQVKLKPFSFMVPKFDPVERVDKDRPYNLAQNKQEDPILAFYEKTRQELNLPCNQYISVKDKIDIKVELEGRMMLGQPEVDKMTPDVLNGYDGFGGVHDNLVWDELTGNFTYTMNNKLIFESLKQRMNHKVMFESTVRLSCLAQYYVEKQGKTPAQTFVAVGEGEPVNSDSLANILIFHIEKQSLVTKLPFHAKGVQSLAFLNKGQYLVSLGTYEGRDLAIWEVSKGENKACAQLQGAYQSKIITFPERDEYEEPKLEFVTVGAQGSFTFWSYHEDTEELIPIHVEMPTEDLKNTNFVSACYIPENLKISGAQSKVLLLGDTTGKLYAYNLTAKQFMYINMPHQMVSAEITHIDCDNKKVIFGTSQGQIVMYDFSVAPSDVLMRDNVHKLDRKIISLKDEGHITALQYNAKKGQGVCGTSAGSIYFFQFEDKEQQTTEQFRLVSRASPSPDAISHIYSDAQIPYVFLTSCGDRSGDVKLYSSQYCDLVNTFDNLSLGPVKFVIGYRGKQKLIGHENGCLKFVNLEKLSVETIYQLQLEEGETLTCANFNENNVVVGTSLGAIFFISEAVDQESDGRRMRPVLQSGKVRMLTGDAKAAVTSVQMQPLTPDTGLLVAFDNGQVWVWRSFIANREDKLKDIQKKLAASGGKAKAKKRFDIYDFTKDMIFDRTDAFDMIKEHQHINDDLSQEDYFRELNIFEGRKFPSSKAMFAPGSLQLDQYICYCSDFQYIHIVLNYDKEEHLKERKRINLCHSPTSCYVYDLYYAALINQISLKGSNNFLLAVGTEEGKILIYRINDYESCFEATTTGGLSYGQITSIAVNFDSAQSVRMVAGSESGELFNFNLDSVIRNLSQQRQLI